MSGGRLLKPEIREEALRTYLRFALIGPLTWIAAILTAIFIGSAVTLVLMAATLVIFLVVELPVPVADASPSEPSSNP
jgi:Na+-driven multidrug efflux pump